MTKKIPFDFKSLGNIFTRPEQLNDFARESMGRVHEMLKDRENYNCATWCSQCCYGSILMSYTEFNSILLHLEYAWSIWQVNKLLQDRVGIVQDHSTMLCPFLDQGKESEHCQIYQVRPLICRIFGTTAAPCNEDIEPVTLEEELFYWAYDQLYYANNQFIALTISEDWALFKSPFAFWCLADNDQNSRDYLQQYILENNDSFHAVLYHLKERHFFTIAEGERIIISR